MGRSWSQFRLNSSDALSGQSREGAGNRRFPRGAKPLVDCDDVCSILGDCPCSRREADRSNCNAGVYIMKVGVYSIRDVKADAFMQTWNAPTDGVAAREFTRAVKNPDSNMAKNPEDFALYRVGSFDENSGELVAQLPAQICTAVSCL